MGPEIILEDSKHWKIKRAYRKDIEDWAIEYAILKSPMMKDRHSADLFNAIWRIPPSGRTLKVIYRRLAKNKIKVITAYWLD